MVIEHNEKFKIFSMFLTAGEKQRRVDPTNSTHLLPKLEIDEWSSKAEIESEQKRASEVSTKFVSEEKEKTSNMLAEGDNKETENMEDMEDDLSGQLEEHLLSHASFTMALLERLCIFIAEAGVFERAPEVIQSLAKAREIHSDRLVLYDRIGKLLQEILDLESQLHYYKQQKFRAERSVDRLTEELVTLRASSRAGISNSSSGTSMIASSSSSGDGQCVPSNGESIGKMRDADLEKELRDKISLLETQLAESESAKSKVEMTLTERLARPLTQTEAQIADMRKSMEELRQQCKQRVSSLIAEVTNCIFNFLWKIFAHSIKL